MEQISPVLWLDPPAKINMEVGELYLWKISLTASKGHLKQMKALLSPAELARVNRLLSPVHKKRFILAHGALRSILSRYIPLLPSQLEFFTNDYDKPFLSAQWPLQFNLSHSGELALLGVVKKSQLGVDIECIREKISHLQIAERFFSPREVETIQAMGDSQRAFFLAWTRKEAFIKAVGMGLSIPLNSFEIPILEGQPFSVDKVDQRPWQIWDIPMGQEYASAVVIEGAGDFKIHYWKFLE